MLIFPFKHNIVACMTSYENEYCFVLRINVNVRIEQRRRVTSPVMFSALKDKVKEAQ